MTLIPQIDIHTTHSPITGSGGMVATSQKLAVEAGLSVLRQGGSAADAAIATAAALNVTEPTSTGLGGDCFALYYEAGARQVFAMNGSGRAPSGLSIGRLRKEGFSNALPPYHPYTITVPGACAGWCDLVDRFGRLDMAANLEPAIRLAEGGFPVAPITAYFWERGAEKQLSQAVGGSQLTLDGRAPRAGEIFRNPGLANTLRLIAEGGKTAFYQGPIAESIAAVIRQAGGCLSLEDLASHHSDWVDPISTVYRGFRMWECPPNGQGLTALLALNILSGWDLSGLDPFSPKRLHLMIEAVRLAFADTRWYVCDPAFQKIPLAELLSMDYAAQRRALINPDHAVIDPRHGSPTSSSNTVYLSVVDGEGNACSFINSNYMGFGTGIVPEGRGFSLQNRGHNFSLDENHPNALAPGKRPYHTIIPAMLTHSDNDSLAACLGVMGGFMQPQGHVQVVTSLVDDGLNPQAALDRPRFCIDAENSGGTLSLEEGFPEETIQGLKDRGHTLEIVRGMDRALFGRGQIIQPGANPETWIGGSDPRADGCARPVRIPL